MTEQMLTMDNRHRQNGEIDEAEKSEEPCQGRMRAWVEQAFGVINGVFDYTNKCNELGYICRNKLR